MNPPPGGRKPGRPARRPASGTTPRRSRETDQHSVALRQRIEDRQRTMKKFRDARGRQIDSILKRLSARARDGGDRPSMLHNVLMRRIKLRLSLMTDTYLAQMDQMIPSKIITVAERRALAKKVELMMTRFKSSAVQYEKTIIYAVRALAGPKGRLTRADYARMESLIKNINTLYANVDNLFSKDVKIFDIMKGIQERTLGNGPKGKKHWDVICKYIAKYSFETSVTRSRERIRFNVTAMFLTLMSPRQRYRAVLEYEKRNPGKGKGLADALVSADLINIRQRESLIQKMTRNASYRTSPAEERRLHLQQKRMRVIVQKVQKRMSRPHYINGAERMFNRKVAAGSILGALGFLSMATNWFAAFNKAKGIGKLVAGFKSPHFWLGAVAAGAGLNYAKKGLTPGASEGFLHRIFPKRRSLDNPFGQRTGDKKPKLKNKRFSELADICGNHGLMQHWLLNQNGFTELYKYRRNISLQAQARKVKKSKVTPRAGQKPYSFIDEFANTCSWQSKFTLLKAVKTYGKGKVEEMILRLSGITKTLGISSTRQFKAQKVPGQMYTYHTLLKHRQGLPVKLPRRAPAPKRPATGQRRSSSAPATRAAPARRAPAVRSSGRSTRRPPRP